MAYGLETVTAEGRLLTSTEAKNLHFMGYAWHHSTSGQADTRQYRITSVHMPVIFVRLPVGYRIVVYAMQQIDGNTWQFTVQGNGKSVSQFLGYAPLQWHAPNHAYGLRTIANDGTVSFDSSWNPLWIAEAPRAYSASVTSYQWYPHTFAYSYINPAFTCYNAYYATSEMQIYLLGIERTANGFKYEWVNANTGGAYGPDTSIQFINSTVLVTETHGV